MALQQDLWVFGYGSLMWNPGFPHVERRPALLEGCARRFALWSTEYRGTAERPGLVLTLEPTEGATCRGVAFRVAAGAVEETLAGLRARELVTGAYEEAWRPVRLLDEAGGAAEAVCYLARLGHPQHAGGLSLAEQAAIIARAQGRRGPNPDYLFSTLEALRAEGVRDEEMEDLGVRVAGLLEGGAS
ncbi:gamma-glutamylcyclotransferase [Neomegalonema sp.]|uniref:gamma-glutamylcyclotransferase n=1 Tax=Neomegalonema sp. TaxID=2039713 RepID=UPI002601A457|nr:gamma-glutamylcyclotransferase [Neomegalonema sp.]MDD2867221.1 gamma-glutamylcyclotransferase [Neomegalonema sp.]